MSTRTEPLGSILGTELTEAELLPTFDLFIKDLDEVKVGLIRNLAAFVGVLSPTTRMAYLPVLAEIKAETDNWRFRHLLAAQLGAFASIYPTDAASDELLPLALSLATDTVAEVRLALALALALDLDLATATTLATALANTLTNTLTTLTRYASPP